jgi:hypothetical protein
MSVDISVSITEDVVDIIATPTVNIVNVTNSASIDPGLYDLSEFTNTSVNPFVRTSGLSAYVPSSRTLTINGVTQDLSANRTFTVSTGITIGTTAITSGTVGRVLFEGTGNVVQESGNFFWDETNGRLGVGTSSPLAKMHIATASGTPAIVLSDVSSVGTIPIFQFRRQATSVFSLQIDFPSNNKARFQIGDAVTGYDFTGGNVGLTGGRSIEFGGITGQTATAILGSVHTDNNNGQLLFSTRGSGTLSERMRIFNDGNIGINTTTNAGFKLDVNGTARVQNQLTTTGSINASGAIARGVYMNQTLVAAANNDVLVGLDIQPTFTTGAFTGVRTLDIALRNGSSIGVPVTNQYAIYMATSETAINSPNLLSFQSGTVTRMRIVNNGNVLIGTITDVASSKLTIESTTQGFLPPRMTTTQKNAIATPAEGLQVWDTTLKLMFVYNGTTWISL